MSDQGTTVIHEWGGTEVRLVHPDDGFGTRVTLHLPARGRTAIETMRALGRLGFVRVEDRPVRHRPKKVTGRYLTGVVDRCNQNDAVVPREVVALEDRIHAQVVAALHAGVSADRIVSVVARALVPDGPGHERGARCGCVRAEAR